MKNFVLMLATTLAFSLYAKAGQWHPEPGNPGHTEPPKDWVCSNGPSVPPAHQCDCQHSCVKNQICDDDGCVDDPEGGLHVQENAKCKVWCFPNHCGCAVKGCESTH